MFCGNTTGRNYKWQKHSIIFYDISLIIIKSSDLYRFITHVFGHAGWEHFIGNATYLLLLGPVLEEKYKSRTLIEIIIITALVTGIINYIFFPNIALCGASGIVFAFIILASFTGFKDGEIPLTFILVATIYIGQQIYDGITVNDNVSQMAHITGGLVGSITGYILNKKTVTQ